MHSTPAGKAYQSARLATRPLFSLAREAGSLKLKPDLQDVCMAQVINHKILLTG